MSLTSDKHLVLEEFSTELLAAPKWHEMENVRRATQCTYRNVNTSGARAVRASAVHTVHAETARTLVVMRSS